MIRFSIYREIEGCLGKQGIGGAQSFSQDPERSDAKLGKEITSQVPRIDTINGGIKALVV